MNSEYRISKFFTSSFKIRYSVFDVNFLNLMTLHPTRKEGLKKGS
jgi:hypothetical protein